MENGNNSTVKAKLAVENGVGRWRFGPNETLAVAGSKSIRGTLSKVISCVDESGPKPLVSFGNGDPSVFPCFHTTPFAEDAIIEAVRSAKHNHYPPFVGLLPARRYDIFIFLL
jgi:tyrosine aminotransferase